MSGDVLSIVEAMAAERRRLLEAADINATLATAATALPVEFLPTLADRFRRACSATTPTTIATARGLERFPPVDVRRGDIARAVSRLVLDEHAAGRLPRVIGGAL